jgi:hypothetical protein
MRTTGDLWYFEAKSGNLFYGVLKNLEIYSHVFKQSQASPRREAINFLSVITIVALLVGWQILP